VLNVDRAESAARANGEAQVVARGSDSAAAGELDRGRRLKLPPGRHLPFARRERFAITIPGPNDHFVGRRFPGNLCGGLPDAGRSVVANGAGGHDVVAQLNLRSGVADLPESRQFNHWGLLVGGRAPCQCWAVQ
jgi:hypothetical protein